MARSLEPRSTEVLWQVDRERFQVAARDGSVEALLRSEPAERPMHLFA